MPSLRRVRSTDSGSEREGLRSITSLRVSMTVSCAALLLAVACTPPPPQPPDQLPPVAVAGTAGSFGPAPFEASFLSNGSHDPDGTIASYSWDFGDGTTSTAANPTKVYASAGTYEVFLTVVDDDGLATSSGTFTVTAHTPGDPASLVFFPELSRSVGLGQDLIAVWTCHVTGSDGPVHDPADVAAWAEAEADAYYSFVSENRYDPVFTPVGTFTVADNAQCLDEAKDRTGSPYTNVLTVDTTTDGGSVPGVAGRGGPGSVYSDGTGTAPEDPPSVSGRGLWITGRSYSEFPNPHVLVHEIGHTLHWPHSFLDPAYEYDNPLDIMSAYVGPQSCTVPGWIYHCEAQHTLAVNRWAAGWIDPDQVVIHDGATQQVDLVRPGLPGDQLVAAPSTNSSQAFLTVEARPKVGFDDIIDAGGVAVHVVDQREGLCDLPDSFGGCPSLWHRQGQAWGAPFGYDHVLQPGESHTVHGVTISVDSAITDGYRVTVSGAATIPVGALEVEPPASALRRSTRHEGGGYSIDLPSMGG